MTRQRTATTIRLSTQEYVADSENMKRGGKCVDWVGLVLWINEEFVMNEKRKGS